MSMSIRVRQIVQCCGLLSPFSCASSSTLIRNYADRRRTVLLTAARMAVAASKGGTVATTSSKEINTASTQSQSRESLKSSSSNTSQNAFMAVEEQPSSYELRRRSRFLPPTRTDDVYYKHTDLHEREYSQTWVDFQETRARPRTTFERMNLDQASDTTMPLNPEYCPKLYRNKRETK